MTNDQREVTNLLNRMYFACSGIEAIAEKGVCAALAGTSAVL